MPNPYWVGDLQVYLSCPSVGLWGQYVGRSDFTNMFVGEWNTATFDLPSNILQALVGNATDCQFRIAVNTASGSGAFNFDQLGFLN
jgi:hypothetical protein